MILLLKHHNKNLGIQVLFFIPLPYTPYMIPTTPCLPLGLQKNCKEPSLQDRLTADKMESWDIKIMNT